LLSVRSDTRQHLKKVYSALTLTLLAAAGGSILAHMIPILANVWINMLGSMFLIYNIGKSFFNPCLESDQLIVNFISANNS
jgi:FtsH-binding integral membrane protein